MKSKLGKQRVWNVQVGTKKGEGTIKVFREDGKYFEIGMITKGFDRPMLLNYGIGKISAILMDGKVAVEPESIVTTMDGEEKIEQDRVLRASSDNPNYSGLPDGFKTGANFLDGQRIIYRDGLPENYVSVVTETPKRKIKINGEETFIQCKMISLKELGQTADGPGKAAIFDAMAKYLTEEELSEIVEKVEKHIRRGK